MAVDIPGVISIIIFYILILAVGIWAGRKSAKSNSAVEAFLADRNMGLIVSFFTLTGKAPPLLLDTLMISFLSIVVIINHHRPHSHFPPQYYSYCHNHRQYGDNMIILHG